MSWMSEKRRKLTPSEGKFLEIGQAWSTGLHLDGLAHLMWMGMVVWLSKAVERYIPYMYFGAGCYGGSTAMRGFEPGVRK